MSKFVVATLDKLEGKLELVKDRYLEVKNKRNDTRHVQLELIQVTMSLIKTLDLTNPDNQLRIHANSTEEADLIKRQIVTGAMLFVAKQIKQEYDPSTLTQYIPFYSRFVIPENSILYQQLYTAMGVSEVNQMDEEDEVNLINQFRCFFEDSLELSLGNSINTYTNIEGLNISKTIHSLSEMAKVHTSLIKTDDLIRAGASMKPIQNSGYEAINNHLDASTLRMWKKMMSTSSTIPKPDEKDEKWEKWQEDLTQSLSEVQKPQRRPRLVEYNLNGYRRAFEDDGDTEALIRIDEYEKNRTKFKVKHCEFKEELVERCKGTNKIEEKNGDKRGPLLTEKMQGTRALFFSQLSHEIEKFNHESLNPVEPIKVNSI